MPEAPKQPHTLSRLLSALPDAQLAEITRVAAVAAIQTTIRRELGDVTVGKAVHRLFPRLPKKDVERAANRLTLNAIRDACWKSMMESTSPRRSQIHCPDEKALKALREYRIPTILGLWHFGPLGMIPFGLRRIGVKAHYVTSASLNRWTRTLYKGRGRIAVDKNEPESKAAAVRDALAHLRSGGTVAMAIDGSQGDRRVTLPFLGRQFSVSRGAAALARVTGATIVPCHMEWQPKGWSMAIRIGEGIPHPVVPPEDREAFETQYLMAVLRYFERYARTHPGQFKLQQLAELVKAPRITG